MRVISRKHIPFMVVGCGTCESILELVPNDFDRALNGTTTFDCEVCGIRNRIARPKIPFPLEPVARVPEKVPVEEPAFDVRCGVPSFVAGEDISDLERGMVIDDDEDISDNNGI